MIDLGLRPDPRRERFGLAVDDALQDDLYRRSSLATVVLVVALLVMRSRILGFAPVPSVRWAFDAAVGVNALRLLTLFLGRRKQGRWKSPSFRRRAAVAGALISGLGFGIVNLMAYPHLAPQEISLLGLIQAGILSGAQVSMGASPGAYLAYILPNMGAFVFCLARDPRSWEGADLLFVLILLLLVVLVVMAVQGYWFRLDHVLLSLELREMALQDGLTGIANRHYLSVFMEKEVERTVRSWALMAPLEARSRLGLLILDVDRFKAVNDSHGHAGGDAVLQQFARIIRGVIRGSDVAARWGGEEFVIVLRDAQPEGIRLVAERLRQRVADHPFTLPSGKVIHLTCSIGWTLFPLGDSDPALQRWEHVLDVADGALYHAKQAGRDRVVGVQAMEGTGAAALDTLRRDLAGAIDQGMARLIES